MRGCRQCDDVSEEVVVWRGKPFLGDVHSSPTAVVATLVPGIVKFGFIRAVILLVDAVL